MHDIASRRQNESTCQYYLRLLRYTCILFGAYGVHLYLICNLSSPFFLHSIVFMLWEIIAWRLFLKNLKIELKIVLKIVLLVIAFTLPYYYFMYWGIIAEGFLKNLRIYCWSLLLVIAFNLPIFYLMYKLYLWTDSCREAYFNSRVPGSSSTERGAAV